MSKYKKDIAIIISWRSQPKRVYSFKKLLKWYKSNYSNFKIIISDSDTKNFSLSRSRNLGAQKAIYEGYKILIFSDADAFVEKKCLDMAIENSINNNEITAPYSRLIQHMSQEETYIFFNKEYSIDQFSLVFNRPFILENNKINHLEPCSTNIVVPSNIYQEIGGFEEKINSWGPEDILFHKNYILLYKKPFRYINGSLHTTFDYKDYRISSAYDKTLLELELFIKEYRFSDSITKEYNNSINIK